MLANLGETDLLAEAVAVFSRYDETYQNIRAILAWLQGKEQEAFALLPRETHNLDMQLLRIRLLLSGLTAAREAEVQTLLDTAWAQVQGSAVLMAEIAELTLHLLQRVVEAGLEEAGLDRALLLGVLRTRINEMMQACHPLAVSFPEGYIRALALPGPVPPLPARERGTGSVCAGKSGRHP